MSNRYKLEEYSKDEIREMPNAPLLWWLVLQAIGMPVEFEDGQYCIGWNMYWPEETPGPIPDFEWSHDAIHELSRWREAKKAETGELSFVEVTLWEDGDVAISMNYNPFTELIATDLETAIARFIALNPVKKETSNG